MGPLVLLRHGESTANAGELFAGWLDVPLTPRGIGQACAAGHALAALRPTEIHTSVLGRAINTAHLLADAAGWTTPLRRDWRLNERHYGALQGLHKDLARSRYGAEDVERWRRAVDVRPPPADQDALARQLADARYGASEARLTRSESLADVAARMRPYWEAVLRPLLADGGRVLVVSHGNALRVLLHLATGRPLAETALAQVPTATPIIPPLGVASLLPAR
ncbi:2,3-bisphosphoglycerate-dependent phosphoglycerate mutase [Nocardioides sp. BP30]|uniref:2,3-bisphosphoglycerate-dependent phosphoglycerate mutase n=1 Tax=Nocardioides sp. BP30 TaxID=3036374 RepID=UPI002469079A|nr:2,3-bisphosphoglycerate-dependent phosphoglycerate mutase [Nocardioides sp. BP30]WGL52486.1 2,3-bisphosphoglycerate-dependent phosphoglycerate mutase [Nocardioides sp. BP30]